MSSRMPFAALITAVVASLALAPGALAAQNSLVDLDYGPRRCDDGVFRFSCGVVVYYGSLADPYPEFGGEQVTVSRSYDDGVNWSGPVAATSTDNKSSFDDHEWLAVDHVAGSPWFG